MAFSFNNIFKKKPKVSKVPFKLISFDTLSDWKKIVYLASFLFIVALAWSGYLFWGVQSGKVYNPIPPVGQSGSKLLNVNMLQQVSEIYIKKSEVFQVLVAGAPAVVDPAK